MLETECARERVLRASRRMNLVKGSAEACEHGDELLRGGLQLKIAAELLRKYLKGND